MVQLNNNACGILSTVLFHRLNENGKRLANILYVHMCRVYGGDSTALWRVHFDTVHDIILIDITSLHDSHVRSSYLGMSGKYDAVLMLVMQFVVTNISGRADN